MRALQVEAGQRFGRLTVIDPQVRKQTPSAPGGLRAALCACDCGAQAVTTISQLSGGTISCGCAQREAVAERNRSHGLTKHPLYGIHQAMMQRCYYEGHPKFARYGGRGITVCDRWHDVRLFIEDIEREIGPRPERYTLDRWPDNDGNYEPGNVRWATRSEQLLNTARHFESVRRAAAPRRPRVANPKAEASRILAADPGISGAQLGRQLGVTGDYGAVLKKRHLQDQRSKSWAGTPPRLTAP